MDIAAIALQVNSLKSFFNQGQTRALSWRRQQLLQLKKMTEDHEDDIAKALEQDLGKCRQEAWTAEIGYLLSEINHSLRHLNKWSKRRRVSTPMVAQPGSSFLLPEPKGVALIIGAWNYPFQLLLAPLVAAIAAGNCAVLKPSELAVNVSALLAKLVPDYLDQHAFVLIEGGVEQTTEVLKQPFDHVFYTGGESVGKIVMRAAAEHLTPVTLELGGKSPCIVDQNTNLKVTARRIVWSKWMNAGQTCVAPDYVIVSKDFSQPLIDAIKQELTAFYGKDSATNGDYGRIINDRHHARLIGYLQGQNIIHGGQADSDTRYLAPTLVLNPDLHSALMQEEIFGPILPIITLDKIEDSIALVNQRAKPLALYLYTNDKDLTERVLHQTSAGSVCINDGMIFMTNPKLPFGGVGNSGMGSYHGQFGFDTFSHLKAVMKRPFIFDVNLRYPPFNRFKLSVLKKLL
ncbi:aldehyde dehydrogenase family protein [Neptunicella sp. SCSIO 80796]|uniref:aldehyde dehydrogenase family protein n=1 Tax=Neptunicella plasticusilytica TaxID=3117012 RepID=UPI003A4D4762